MSIKLFIIIIILSFFFIKTKKNIINNNIFEGFSKNSNYNNICNSDSSDLDRQKCTDSFSKISNKLYDFCIDQNNYVAMNQDVNQNLCKKWIGLLSAECITEKCVDNTINKIDDWNKTLEDINLYKTLEKLQIMKSKYKLYNNNHFTELIKTSNNAINQKTKLNNEINKIVSIHNNTLNKINNNQIINDNELNNFNNYIEQFPLQEKNKIKKYIDNGYDLYQKLKYIDSENNLKNTDAINNFRLTSNNIAKKSFKKIIYNYISDYDKSILIDNIENSDDFYLLNND
jgi:hypothetical protein